MTQTQYNIIVAVISNGAPALANELIGALSEVVEENQKLKNEIAKPEECDKE